MLRFREAELAHGRVSMVAALGFLVQENFHPLFPDIGGSAARQLDTVLQTETGQGIMASLLFTVMLTEIQRARVGWMPPSEGMQQLRPEYVPGDLGFDPLGMRPSSDADLLAMKNKELNNGACARRSASRRLTRALHLNPPPNPPPAAWVGRLAMLAVAYFAAEEVLGGTPELLGSA